MQSRERLCPGIRVRVLGPGCVRCDQLERDVREIMAELKLAGEIARYGILGAPALVIDKKIVSMGSVPHKSKSGSGCSWL